MEEKNKKMGFKDKKGINLCLFFETPMLILGLMILILDYNTNIWFLLKLKPIIFTLLLLEVIHIFLTSVTRK